MSVDWREDLRLKLEDFVDTLVVKGAKQADVYDAIVAEVANLRKAYEHDPDPAEDRLTGTVDEPSNDWPGAQR